MKLNDLEKYFNEQLEYYINGDIKKLSAKNKKLLKLFKTYDIEFRIFALNEVKNSYFSWVIENTPTIEENFNRLIFLINSRKSEIEKKFKQFDNRDYEYYELNIESENEESLDNYEKLCKEVGL